MQVKDEKTHFSKILMFFNFLMLLFITIAQAPIQKAVDTITRNYEKEGREAICKGVSEKREMIYHELFDVITSVCVVSYIDARVDAEMAFARRVGLLKDKADDELVKMREGTVDHFKKQIDTIRDNCENGIQKKVVLEKANYALRDYLEYFHCEEFDYE